MIQRFADVAVDPSNVVLVSKRVVQSRMYSFSTADVVPYDEYSIVVGDTTNQSSFCVIGISAAAAEALLKYFEQANVTDHAGGERDSDSKTDATAASRASVGSRLGDYMFDDILHQFNLFFQGSAKAEVLDGQLHITIGTQTMIVTLPQVAGVQSTAS